MIAPYEDRLHTDPSWALDEGGWHFEGKSLVQKTLRTFAKRLDDLGITYAVTGAMAMFAHGYRRFSNDVDVVVYDRDLRRISQNLAGYDLEEQNTEEIALRDKITGVRVDVRTIDKGLTASMISKIGIVNYLTLAELVDMKLTSGINRIAKRKDLGDVQEMIKALSLPANFVTQLSGPVQETYMDLWQGAQFPDPEANA